MSQRRDATTTLALIAMGALAGGIAPAPLSAQQDTTATFVATISNDETGEPVAGASVAVDDGSASLTDANGHVRIHGIAPGAHNVLIKAFGLRAERIRISFAPGAVVQGTIALAAEPVGLEPLEVLVRRGNSRLTRSGFYKRSTRGYGTFLDQDRIQREAGRGGRLSDLLRGIPGIRVVPSPAGHLLESTRGAVGTRRSCSPPIYLDGMLVIGDSTDIDLITPVEFVAAVEVYSGISEVPARFRGTSPCGAVVIWTR